MSQAYASPHPATDPVLPDVLQPGLRLVFCGTAAGRVSAAAGAYYANPGNYFWRTLHTAGFIPQRLAPAEFRRLPEYGIGLTDLAKHHVGNDADLPRAAFDREALRERILACAPSWLAFTSKNAAQAYHGQRVDYGAQDWRIGATRVFVLPSPSGQARRSWNPALWAELAQRVAGSECPGLPPGFEGELRLARDTDQPGILELEALFPGDRLSPRALRRLIRSPSARVCVVTQAPSGRVMAALVLLTRRNTGKARIYSLAVAPQARGRGLGRILIGWAENLARQAGKREVTLEVRTDNRAARTLYRNLGYTEYQRLAAYYEDGCDALRLKRQLDD